MSCVRNGSSLISSCGGVCWKLQLPHDGIDHCSATMKNTGLVISQAVVDLKANLETFLSLSFVQQSLEKSHAPRLRGLLSGGLE
jgi:hypothetical protein